MSSLMGDELEKDSAFWGHETWQEASEDDKYSTEEGVHLLTAARRAHCTPTLLSSRCLQRSLIASIATSMTRSPVKRKVPRRTPNPPNAQRCEQAVARAIVYSPVSCARV
jgi:hypothetical protein